MNPASSGSLSSGTSEPELYISRSRWISSLASDMCEAMSARPRFESSCVAAVASYFNMRLSVLWIQWFGSIYQLGFDGRDDLRS